MQKAQLPPCLLHFYKRNQISRLASGLPTQLDIAAMNKYNSHHENKTDRKDQLWSIGTGWLRPADSDQRGRRSPLRVMGNLHLPPAHLIGTGGCLHGRAGNAP
jgi:hypothetical protein